MLAKHSKHKSKAIKKNEPTHLLKVQQTSLHGLKVLDAKAGLFIFLWVENGNPQPQLLGWIWVDGSARSFFFFLDEYTIGSKPIP